MTISATQFSFFAPRLSFTENTYLKLEVHVSLACFSPSWRALSMKRRKCGNKERQEREKRRVVSNKLRFVASMKFCDDSTRRSLEVWSVLST